MIKISSSQKRNTTYLAVAVALFLLVGILQFFDDLIAQKAVQYIMSLATHFILIGLAIFWAISIYDRITQKRLRRAIVLLAMFIVLLLFLRFIKYKLFETNEIVKRYLWYAYYIPQTAIPLLMLFAACYVGRDERKPVIGWLKWLAIPAVIMILLIMTNELHEWAFDFNSDFVNWSTDYKHGFIYYLNIAWQLILSVLSVCIVFYKCKISQCRNRIWALIIGFAVFVTLIILSFFGVIRSYNVPELFSLTYVFVFECSVQIGLIPSNGNYPRYFKLSNISAAIINDKGEIAFQSDNACLPSAEEIKGLKSGIVSADGNTVINAQEISGGQIIWSDDLTYINEINAKIKEIQDNLNEESELIRAENELKEKQAKIEETQKIYNNIESAVICQIAEIERILSGASADDADFAEKMKRVGVLGAYVKRRSNLTVIAEKEKSSSFAEVGLCIKESLNNLEVCGVNCAFVRSVNEGISTENALFLYDGFEYAIENIMESITDLTAYLDATNEFIIMRLVMEGKRNAAVKKNPYGNMTVTEDDGTVFVNFRLPKGVER